MSEKRSQVYTSEIASRVKTYREEMKISQEKMAEIIGVTASNYIKMENAYHNLTLKHLMTISIKLNISLDILVFGKTSMDVMNFDEFLCMSKFFDTDNIQELMSAFQYVIDMKSTDNQ